MISEQTFTKQENYFNQLPEIIQDVIDNLDQELSNKEIKKIFLNWQKIPKELQERWIEEWEKKYEKDEDIKLEEIINKINSRLNINNEKEQTTIKWNYSELNKEQSIILKKILIKNIKEIEKCDFKIGQGKTAKICILEKQSNFCLKVVDNKEISSNRTNKEMYFLDKLSDEKFLNSIGINNYPIVPEPLCSAETNKNDYLFMETIDGFSLEDIVRSPTLINHLPNNFDFDYFFKKTEDIVNRLNNNNIYHRDLHAGNIMVNQKGEPIIIDFGDGVKTSLNTENPYRFINSLEELKIYTSDQDNLKKIKLTFKKLLLKKEKI